MSRPYTCAGCRFRLLISRNALVQPGRRRWGSWSHDPGQESASSEAPQQIGPRYSRTPAATPTANEWPDQGSSGQALRPADLLKELEKAPAADTLAQQPSADLLTKFDRFRRACKQDDEALWKAIQALLDTIGSAQDLRVLGHNHAWVTGATWFFTLRTTRSWLEALRGTDIAKRGAKEQGSNVIWTHANPPPGPAVLMSAGSALNVGIVRANWARILWLVSSNLLEMLPQNGTSENNQAIATGLRELMSLWNQYMRLGILKNRDNTLESTQASRYNEEILRNQSTNWNFLPDLSKFSDVLLRQRQTTFANALNLLVPPFIPRSDAVSDNKHPLRSLEIYDNVSSAFVTLYLLRTLFGNHDSPLSKCEDFGPWVNLMERVLKTVQTIEIPPALSQKIHSAEHSPVKASYNGVIAVVEQISATNIERPTTLGYKDNAPQHSAIRNSRIESTGISEPPIQTTSFQKESQNFEPLSSVERFIINTQKRLGRALEQQDLPYAQKIYAKVIAFQTNNPAVLIPLTLYESLIFTFFTFRDAKTAVAVWKQLLSSGQKPTSKTYTLMMKGAQQVRDLKAMQDIWDTMRHRKIQPDAHAWSVRIAGLFRGGRDDAGLQALHDMAREWILTAKAAQKTVLSGQKRIPEASTSDIISRYTDDVNGVPRPNIVVMNSAISVLAGRSDTLIPKVLAWGRSLCIEPDLTTYNVLLNLSMRHSLANEAFKILQQMNERGIEPNSTTWTVLLSAMFEAKSWDDGAPGEQGKYVLDFIDSINSIRNGKSSGEANYFKIDQKGYALVIDRLLKRYNNPEAAQAVLDRMRSEGVQPNAHIYTILMTAYFQRSPPDLEAVEALWQSIRSANHGYGEALDSVFYDRMIEGYAEHHERLGTSAPMLQFLSRMNSEGKKPSWRALTLVSRCLIERGEREQLSKVVADARIRLNEAAQFAGGVRDDSISTGKQDFIYTVLESGILAEEGITSPEQLLNPTILRSSRLGIGQASEEASLREVGSVGQSINDR